MTTTSIEYMGKCILISSSGKKIIAIGDLHLGYEASLNASGVFVTRTLFQTMLDELEEIFDKTGKVDEIILLGDIKHTFGSILKEEWSDTNKIIAFLRGKCDKVVVVKGNHDALTEIIGNKLGFKVVDKYIYSEIAFIHGDRDFPELWNKEIKKIIMGHLHPAIIISDGTKREKYKCFLEGKYKDKEFIIVPSFISANEGTDVREYETELPWPLKLDNFKVYIVGENFEVLDFGKLSSIN